MLARNGMIYVAFVQIKLWHVVTERSTLILSNFFNWKFRFRSKIPNIIFQIERDHWSFFKCITIKPKPNDHSRLIGQFVKHSLRFSGMVLRFFKCSQNVLKAFINMGNRTRHCKWDSAKRFPIKNDRTTFKNTLHWDYLCRKHEHGETINRTACVAARHENIRKIDRMDLSI